ncbi:MAG: enoyl-CoA hydratase-related protein [Pseudobdellovibrionaceae bacterium]
MQYQFLKISEQSYISQQQQKAVVLTCSLFRPEVRNALSPQLIAELTDFFKQVAQKNLQAENEIRAIVLKGEGKIFCAGADLQWMQSLIDHDYSQNKKDALALFDLFESLLDCPAFVITVIQGAAFGGALGLLAGSDLVVSLPDAQFCFSEVKLGIAPAVISSVFAQKNILHGVRPYMLSGQVFHATEATRFGMVHEVSTNPDEAVKKWLESVLASGPLAIQETKALLRRIVYMENENQIEATTDLIAKLRVSPEGQEGLTAFLQKRKPGWVALP